MSANFSEAVGAALAGLRHTYGTQRNFRVQCALAGAAVAACALLDVSALESALILTMTALVLGSELLNTSLEAIVDLQTEEWKAAAKAAKDCAAAAVLLLAGAAAIVGALVLLPAVLTRLGAASVWWLRPVTLAGAIVLGALAVGLRARGGTPRRTGIEPVSRRVVD
jgi:diacylglycerol kinase